MEIRRFQESDAEAVSALLAATLRTTNIKDYSSEYIENQIKTHQPQNISERAGWTHFYVVCDNEKIVGSGAIGPYWGKQMKAVCLLSLFCLNIRATGSAGRLYRHSNRTITF